MAKVGRNDPCPCGSGEKYKRCCWAKDEAAANEHFLAEKAKRAEETEAEHARQKDLEAFIADRESLECEARELDEASNAVIDLINAGRLEEAEQGARALLERYPQVHDGLDRMAMICEKRGEFDAAIEWYDKCLAFVRERAKHYDPEYPGFYEERIAKLKAARTG